LSAAFLLVAFAPFAAAAPNQAEIDRLIQTFGPIMRLHPTERYLMDDPGYILNSGKVALQWGLVHHENDYDKFSLEGVRTAPLASEAALPDAWRQSARDPRAGHPEFRRWLRIDDSLLPGNQSRAKALVSVVEPPDHACLDLQFWFFYPFNGPGKFHVTFGKVVSDHVKMDTVGRHYGDWEHVTLRLVPAAAPANPPWRLADVYLSRHSISKWIGNLSALHFSGRHPIIYIARDSHAHYPAAGTQYYRRIASKDLLIGTLNVDLEDWTGDGPVFDTSQPGHYRMLSNGDPWYSLDMAWGQFEKLLFSYGRLYTYTEVGSGPASPGFHGPDDGK